MNEKFVEVGMKLDKNLPYYHNLLLKNGLYLDYACVTHDIYYTNTNLEGFSEKQMKDKCIRLRFSCGFNRECHENEELLKKEKFLINDGYRKVFDTTKFDFQYANKEMKSRVQLQDIEGIGLLVYYDNPNYYQFSLEVQRRKLIDELNSYGFNFKYETLGLDKLRTLYYKKEMFSINQND